MQLPAYRKHAAHPSFDTKLSVRRTKYPYELTIRIESILLFCFTYVGTIARKLWRTITETHTARNVFYVTITYSEHAQDFTSWSTEDLTCTFVISCDGWELSFFHFFLSDCFRGMPPQ